MLDLTGFVPKRTKIVIGTQEFTFSELSMGDLGEFRGELVQQRKEVNEERRKRLIADAEKIGNIDPMELLKFSDSSISDEELEAQMETIEGIGFMAYLSLRYAHTGISREQAAQIIRPSLMGEISEAMVPDGGDKKKLPTAKTKAKKLKVKQQ